MERKNIFAEKYKNSNIPTFVGENFKKPKNKKGYKHRAGDWVCTLCNNHNYAFRNVCNRCNQ